MFSEKKACDLDKSIRNSSNYLPLEFIIWSYSDKFSYIIFYFFCM